MLVIVRTLSVLVIGAPETPLLRLVSLTVPPGFAGKCEVNEAFMQYFSQIHEYFRAENAFFRPEITLNPVKSRRG